MKKISTLIFLILLFLPSLKIHAEEKSVIISEIMWMGSTRSTADEWLELKNLTSHEIDLSGWKIEGAGVSGSTLIIQSGVIPPNDYFLISNYSKDENTILDIEPDYVENDISLSSSSLKLTLKDSNGIIIDEAGDGGEPLAGDNTSKASMQRIENPGDGTQASDWLTSVSQENIKPGYSELATPNSVTQLPITKIKNSKDKYHWLKISGLVTTPPNVFFDDRLYIQDETGGIRVKLTNGSWPVLEIGTRLTLKGRIGTYYSEKELQITDISEIETSAKENLSPFFIKTGELPLWEGALIKISGKITETSGDTFYVDDGTGPAKIYIKDATGIKTPEKHKGDKAEISGIANNYNGAFRILPRFNSDISISTPVEEIPLMPISQAKLQPKGTKLKVKGVVSVPPGVISKSYFYIQDDTSGIQVYCYYKNFPLLLLGFFIEVIGEISESYGEKRLKISGAYDIIILESRAPPVPQKIKIKDVANFSGMLIKIKGKVTKTSGNTFYISDGTQEIKIVIQKLTGIKKPRLHKGDIVEITGIVSQTKTGYRILPRYQKDFKLVWTKPKKQKKSKIAGASVAHAESLNEPKVIYEVKKETTASLLNLLGWFLILGSVGSLVYLKRIEKGSTL